MQKPDFDELNQLIFPLAHRAGLKILTYFQSGVAVEEKSDESPVTIADRVGEAIIVEGLRRVWPQIDIVGEEMCAAGEVKQPGEQFFLVDALDGTKEFISGHTDFTVNVALVDKGVPRYGLVYAPARGKIYLSAGAAQARMGDVNALNEGTDFKDVVWCDIAVRDWPVDAAVGVMSRSHGDDETRKLLKINNISQTVKAGSSLKLCAIACGDADLYPRLQPTMEWDIAAGHAVLAAAGGVVIDLNGTPLSYGKFERSFRNDYFIACAESSLASLKY